MCYNARHIMTTVIFIRGLDKYPDRAKLAGIVDYARPRGWYVQSVEAIDSREKLKAVIDLWSPAGIIVNCGAGFNPLPPAAYGKMPVVYFLFPDPAGRPVNCVFNDAKSTADLAAKTLLRLNLSAYGYVSWFKPIFWNEARQKAFCDVLSLHGKPIAVFTPRKSGSTHLTRDLVTWLASLPKPVGLFAANDTMARHVADACHLAKLSIPDDVALVGVDNNVEICEGSSPSLTSIRLDHYASGRLAAQLLDELMHTRMRKPSNVAYPSTEVVSRASTRRLAHPDRVVSAIVERIRKDACTGLTAADIIKGLPFSRRIAEIRFREATGKTILEEIRSVRLQKAVALLKESGKSISFIAQQTGYATLPAFSAFFKAETGLSPRAWLKRNR